MATTTTLSQRRNVGRPAQASQVSLTHTHTRINYTHTLTTQCNLYSGNVVLVVFSEHFQD